MKVIAGLGNPGAEYANTPHSIGFEVVDALAREIGASWKNSSSFNGALATGLLGAVKVMLVKPLTFMNLSGNCVAPVLKYHNAKVAEDLLVVSDDIDLPVGKMRIRKGGSAGGHNGLKSVIERTGSPDFIRLRSGSASVSAGRRVRAPTWSAMCSASSVPTTARSWTKWWRKPSRQLKRLN